MIDNASIALEIIPNEFTQSLPFTATHDATISTAPPGFEYIDVTNSIRDPETFHGDKRVHDVVQFGLAMAGLIGEAEPNDLFSDRDKLPESGIIILADHYEEAAKLVDEIDSLACDVINDSRLYQDKVFCSHYLRVATDGYAMLRNRLPDFAKGREVGRLISLERAGLITARLALGEELDAIIPSEVRVVTKRAHPANGDPSELMVTVKWRDLQNIQELEDEIVDVVDFVNPASWSSTAAFLLSAIRRGAKPKELVHRSFMLTDQGVAFARTVLNAMGIESFFYAIGSSRFLTPEYYLTNPAVADAGDVLCNFLENGQ